MRIVSIGSVDIGSGGTKPRTADSTKVQASFKNGILQVTLPKKSYGSETSIE